MQEKAKATIQKLIDKYEEAKQSNQLKKYSEEETKKDFIQPLFESLGWDINNKKEVSAEENISGDRVDYGFYLNGRIAFYLEAKKISADLHREDFANQAIKYSFNKGAVWAVLTDFESVKVFNCQDISKSLADKLYFEIPYNQFVERFDQLWQLSKESFEAGLIDKEAERVGKKFQRIAISEILAKDLNECRKILTDALGEWNNIKGELLDEGVQKLLDRLVFLRVAEDRGIEDKTLLPMLREWKASKTKNEIPFYKFMVDKFRELDGIYNSNLFSKHPFEDWEEYGGATEKVISILQGKEGYYEYDFKMMPADVLGSVYESYLGYKLSQSKKETTVVGKDSKKRKEQGIYYTPRYIVDYIVENSLGPVLAKCRSVEDIKKIRVLDPACGSGSFLIKAMEMIAQKYEELGYKNKQLTKIQILTENIYGVDLDEQAVEIARLNLLIGALEERMILPSLAKNIKNGNSLISGSEEELKKYFGKNFKDKKPFNWQEEFPEVFPPAGGQASQGGFDVIIGNPPYIKEFVNKSVFDGLHISPYYQGKMDIWTMFACVAIDLLKDNGLLSFISPNNWITNAGASIFRNKMLKDGELKQFIDFGDYKVFEDAGIQTMIFVFEKGKVEKEYGVKYLKIEDKNINVGDLIVLLHKEKSNIIIQPEKMIDGMINFADSKTDKILEKIKSKKNFELTEKEVGQGIVADPDKAFIFKEDDDISDSEREVLKNYFTSVGRYFSGEQRGKMAYLSKAKNYEIDNLSNIKNQLLQYEEELKNRREVKSGRLYWFNIHWPRDERFFNNGAKIVCGIRTEKPSFFYTENEYYGSRALNFIKTERINLKYLTGILNSNISFFWLKNKGKQLGDLLQVDKGPLLDIPIYKADEKEQEKIIKLVDRMLELNKEIKELGKEEEGSNQWAKIGEEIEKTDKQIDAEVYQLYGLSDEEIKVVEK